MVVLGLFEWLKRRPLVTNPETLGIRYPPQAPDHTHEDELAGLREKVQEHALRAHEIERQVTERNWWDIREEDWSCYQRECENREKKP